MFLEKGQGLFSMNKSSGEYIYVVEMLRNGDRETHSYILGIFSDRYIAECEAKIHINMRANKYCAEVREEVVDGYGGRGLVCYLDEAGSDEEDYEADIESRRDYIKYLNKQKEKYLKHYREDKT